MPTTAALNLRTAIIQQAVNDWNALCEGRDIPETSFASLRVFFTGKWCAVLCGDVNPLYILRRLEQKRELIMNREENT
jgi:hypothetical protein